jgi:uncharacterized protein (TIGR02996 family)
MNEDAFSKLIAEHPTDIGPRLAFADWLEEHGDPRAAEVRFGCRYRMPIAQQEMRHLPAISAARRAANASQVRVAVNATNPGHAFPNQAAQAAFAADLRHLSLVDIARHFPRDDTGRLQLNCAVLLARHSPGEQLSRRELWLAIVGPARRADPQVLTVQLEMLIGENHFHNWSRFRWYWDRRDTHTEEQDRWGITGAALAEVTGPPGDRRFVELEGRWRAGTLSETERIALCTGLQDRGRFEDALRTCNIDYPDELTRLLNAETLELPGGGDYTGSLKSGARAQKLRRALWEAAPWRFARALQDEQARLDAWRQERAGRARKTPQPRLFILPGAPHARKPGLMLLSGSNGVPRLAFQFTAANVVLPETAWKRPVELDIARWSGRAVELMSG